jgi:hypothetical protein
MVCQNHAQSGGFQALPPPCRGPPYTARWRHCATLSLGFFTLHVEVHIQPLALHVQSRGHHCGDPGLPIRNTRYAYNS